MISAQTAARQERYGLPATVKHGVSAYVNWGCRCAPCTTGLGDRSRDRS